MDADLVDPGILYRLEGNLISTKRIRGSWSSTVTTIVIACFLLLLVFGFLVAQYNQTVKLKTIETAKKNIPPSQFAWNNSVRNIVSL